MTVNAEKLTPAMKQFHKFKQQHPDSILFFRMGDFYETFYEDAKTCSKVLGLTLTSRSKATNPIPLAGVPYHAVDGYLKKMLQAGYKVAVCEQVEDPKTGSLLVAKHGKGHYIYTGLSFFREFPAGVSGAYRLFANMLSIGKDNINLDKKLTD